MKRLSMIVCTLAAILLLAAPLARAEGPEPLKLKSETTAWILALDPVPGDALFYGGKPVQGTINLLIGGAAGGLFWWSVAEMAGGCQPPHDCDDLRAIQLAVLAPSLAVYFSFLLWDGIGGVKGVEKHNREVEDGQSLLKRIEPQLAFGPGGAIVGATVHF
jgi:hypothetical protein